MNRVVLGIGGYIGAGKTLAGKFFEQKGAFFIDADRLVRDLYEPEKDGHRKVVNYFGENFLKKNGEIDRSKLGKFVFSDPNKLKILNHVIHPLVTNEVQKKLDAVSESFIVLEAAYFEPQHLGRFIDALLWIDSSKDVLLKRVLERPQMIPGAAPGMTKEYFETIIRTQMKPEKIDYTITNKGTVEHFYSDLDVVYLELKKRFSF